MQTIPWKFTAISDRNKNEEDNLKKGSSMKDDAEGDYYDDHFL